MDRDYLEKERESIASQQANALAVYHQACGALAMLDNLLAKLSADNADALEQVKGMTGAESAEIVKMDRDDER